MTEAVKNWMLSILSAARLLGVLEAAVPKGPVRSVVRLAAGLVLAIVVFSPLVGALPGWISGALGSEWEAAAAFSDDLEQTNESYLETIMSQRAAEYIVTQAEEMGVSLTASVTCDWTEEGLPVPAGAVLQGDVPEQARQALSELIQADLGIPAEQISYEEAAS